MNQIYYKNMMQNDMKFKTDRIYIALQFLIVSACYFLAYIFLLRFKIENPLSFYILGSLVCIALYFGPFFPGNIIVDDGTVSFRRLNRPRNKVKISDITNVETSSGLYNTVKITTKSSTVYSLPPKDPEALVDYLEQRISK